VRSFGFLLSRRWVLFALVVAVLAYAAWWLGGWQFRRLDDRKADNAVVRTNEHREITPVGDVLSPDGHPTESDEWRVVSATGTYDPEQTVVVRYRTRDGAQGIDVVVPLVTADGTALLVDRGWLETDPSGADREDIPAPPSGEVAVTGYVRANGTGDSTRVSDRSTRAISSDEIGPALGRSVYGGFVELRSGGPGARYRPGGGRAAGAQQRAALLLRAPVVVLRGPCDLRLLLPALRRVAPRPPRRAAHPTPL